MKRIVYVGVVLCLLAACGSDKKPQAAATAVVNAVEVLEQDLPWNMEYPAQVVGSLEIQVRAQVGGILTARLYNEGEFVETGTQLFQIDDQPYKVALEKAAGALAQAQAEEKRTYRTYSRMKRLRADNAISQQDYDNALSAYETAKANVQVAQAGVNDAQINLGYTRVTAPISGIASKEAQSVGSLIAPANESGLLTTMVQIHPLHVNFSMPSSQFNQLAAGFNAGKISLGDSSKSGAPQTDQEYRDADANDVSVYVEAILPNGNLYPQRGKIIFFDSTENVQTSSLEIKAEFANPEHRRLLMPGQFIRVRLVGAVYKNAVLIPPSAVLNTAQGLVAYVIGADNTVEARPIEAHLQGDIYVVSKGLKAGERVVNGGLVKIRAGQQVEPQLQKFEVPGQNTQVQPQAVNGDTIGKLEDEIQSSEAPDTESLSQQAQTQPVAVKTAAAPVPATGDSTPTPKPVVAAAAPKPATATGTTGK